MNVYGNGGMLTTVGDWLKWNAMLDSRSMGVGLVEALETQGVLNNGRKISYALGLSVDTYKGLRDISHGGSTGGYQTFLARYPDQKTSVAVLCNGTSPSAGGLAASITDEILGPYPPSPSGPKAVDVSEDDLKRYVALWRSEKTHRGDRTTFEKGKLLLNGTPLFPLGDGKFMFRGTEVTYNLGPDKRPVSAVADSDGDISRYFAEQAWTPTAVELNSLAGDWHSEEAQASVKFVVEGGKAFITQRPTLRLPLDPLYKDQFEAPRFVIWFTRNAKGAVDKMHVGTSRMRDMSFRRVPLK
jgi:hypothetical protein